MIHRITTLVVLVAAILLGIIVQSTTPQTVGPGGILTVFFLLYVIASTVFMYLIIAFNRILRDVGGYMSLRKPVETIPAQHALYYASVIAFGPILVVGMSSVGKSGFTEWALVVLFVVIGVFYLRKRL